MIEIKHRYTDTVLYYHTPEGSVKDAVEAAVKSGANLDGANLRGANLDGANLDGANLYGEVLKISPLTFCGLRYFAIITHGFMQLGCQRHTHEEWAAFDDRQILGMDGRAALEFWKANKDWLLAACAAHRAEADRA